MKTHAYGSLFILLFFSMLGNLYSQANGNISGSDLKKYAGKYLAADYSSDPADDWKLDFELDDGVLVGHLVHKYELLGSILHAVYTIHSINDKGEGSYEFDSEEYNQDNKPLDKKKSGNGRILFIEGGLKINGLYFQKSNS
jgi:hypothetical protein